MRVDIYLLNVKVSIDGRTSLALFYLLFIFLFAFCFSSEINIKQELPARTPRELEGTTLCFGNHWPLLCVFNTEHTLA